MTSSPRPVRGRCSRRRSAGTKLFGADDRVKWVVGPGGHGTPLVVREAIYDWMIRWLANGDAPAEEDAIALLPDQSLWVTANGQVERARAV